MEDVFIEEETIMESFFQKEKEWIKNLKDYKPSVHVELTGEELELLKRWEEVEKELHGDE
jgi:hypothetical protein